MVKLLPSYLSAWKSRKVMAESKPFDSLVPESPESINGQSTVISVDTAPVLQHSEETAIDKEKRQQRVPKRVLHFSDGILEEFSSDETGDEEESAEIRKKNVDQLDAGALIEPSTLTWGPYLWYQVTKMGSRTLAACDFLGEHLADFFGITSPKYQFEIEEYFRMKKEEEEERNKSIEMLSWCEKGTSESNGNLVAQQPTLSSDKERY